MQLPSAHVARAIIQRYARLRARLGDELGQRPFVLPNADFFPDAYHQDAESAAALAERMQMHAGMLDIPIRTRTIDAGAPSGGATSCSSGACGVPQMSAQGLHRVTDEGDNWLLQIPAAELRHPVALTTNLARSLAFIFLVETKREGEVLEPPVDITADFTAVALGFGALMLQGSYIYAKSCGGPQIASVTKVSVGELSIAVALFAALGGHQASAALKHLEVTQRSVLADADYLLRSNKKLISRLASDPSWIAQGSFALEEPGGFLSGLLRGRRDKRKQPLEERLLEGDFELDEVAALMIDMPPSSSVTGRPSRPPTPDPAREELKGLVSEALGGARL